MITTNTVKPKLPESKEMGKMITTNKTQPKDFRPKGKPQPISDVRVTTANVKELQKVRKKEVAKEKNDAKIRQKKLNEEISAYKAKELSREEDRAVHDGELVYRDENGKLFVKQGKERVYLDEKT